MPVIKWSGSKRTQAKEILSYFPKRIKTYYEPFIGGGSILNALIQSDIAVDRYICSDLNDDLINLYKAIMLIISLYVRVYSDSRKIRREFCISIHLDSLRIENESYAEFTERQLVADLANVILHIIRFIKTGVIEMEEIEGCKCLTGGLKHLI